jgi:DNA-binding CsgD family transcriptional regulator
MTIQSKKRGRSALRIGRIEVAGQTLLVFREPKEARPALRYGLTALEEEALALVAEGLSLSEVAKRRGVSLDAVGHAIDSACRKVGLPRRERAPSRPRSPLDWRPTL